MTNSMEIANLGWMIIETPFIFPPFLVIVIRDSLYDGCTEFMKWEYSQIVL